MNKTMKFLKGFDGYHNCYDYVNENAEYVGMIRVTSLDSFYKYVVSFAYNHIEDNLNKGRKFHTLSEAKKYVLEVVSKYYK